MGDKNDTLDPTDHENLALAPGDHFFVADPQGGTPIECFIPPDLAPGEFKFGLVGRSTDSLTQAELEAVVRSAMRAVLKSCRTVQ